MTDDVKICRAYLRKVQSSKDREIPFLLTYSQFKRLYKRKRCFYTGIVLTNGDIILDSTRTLDRMDATQGYTVENTVACCHKVNMFKERFDKDLPLANIIFLKVLKHYKKKGIPLTNLIKTEEVPTLAL